MWQYFKSCFQSVFSTSLTTSLYFKQFTTNLDKHTDKPSPGIDLSNAKTTSQIRSVD